MFYKKFYFQIVLRVMLILANTIGIGIIFGDNRLFFNQIILALILIGQVLELIRFVNHTNRELTKFLLAIKYSDFSINFQKTNQGKSFSQLYQAFTEIIQAYKETKIEKEAQFQYLREVVSHINVGIISLENDEDIVLMNRPAEMILGIEGVRNWQIFKEKKPEFGQAVEYLGKGRTLIELTSNGDTKTLSVDISSILLLGKNYKLITFQDIKGEIEQKEIEAWHKLIRILTHEIMNSVTPISSLTETMQMMLEKNGEPRPLSDIDQETINDIRFSLGTIQKRSEGMMDFIDDYRKLTRVPKPKPEATKVKELFDRIRVLMQQALNKNGVELMTETDDTVIDMDSQLIEQVLINMVTNSIHALAGVNQPEIILACEVSDGAKAIIIQDNGQGIPEKELKEIFVPFFTTKQHGSGIGLSLSKQIIAAHGGTIKVTSKPGEGTTFKMRFPG